MYPIKYLSFGLNYKSGLNNKGRKVVKSKGSRKLKRKYRIIDFYRENYLVTACVLKIEYDPNRTAKIALLCYKNGIISYVIAVEGMKEGDFISQRNRSLGLVKQVGEMNPGTYISCLELRPGYGAKLIRSAGCFGIILDKKVNKTIIRLPSGEERFFKNFSKASIGVVSNIKHHLEKKQKAGINSLLGLKPKVRGVAKNSVDHPHGGGRGKTSK